MELKVVTVDGVPVEVSDTAAAVISKVVAARDGLKATYDEAIAATADEHLKAIAAKDAEIVAKDAEIVELRKDVMTPAARDAMVSQWAGMMTDARRLMPALVADGKTCHEVRKEVLAHVIAGDASAAKILTTIIGADSATASEQTIKTAFDVAASLAPASKPAPVKSNVGDALAGKQAEKVAKPVGRAAFLANMADNG